MKKPTKVLLGLATVWPFFYLILFFVVIFSTIVFLPGPEGPGSGPPPLITLIFPLHLFTMLAVMALMVFYIVDLFRNERVDKDKKVLWAIVLFMGSMIAMPIYWYLYIWREVPVVNSPPRSMLKDADAFAWASNTRGAKRDEQYVPPSQPPNWRE